MEKDSVYSKRYALLAHWKPEKFLKVAQESVAVRAYSVGCFHHSCYLGFLRTSNGRVGIFSTTLPAFNKVLSGAKGLV